MTKLCEHCRAPLSGGKVCGKCGRPAGSQAPVWSLVVGDSLPPIEQLQAGSKPRECPCCHLGLPLEAKFCGSCGTRL